MPWLYCLSKEEDLIWTQIPVCSQAMPINSSQDVWEEILLFQATESGALLWQKWTDIDGKI